MHWLAIATAIVFALLAAYALSGMGLLSPVIVR